MQENRLQWYGHIKRRPTEYIGNTTLNLDIPGQRRRGRPKLRWMSVVNKDMHSCELEEEDVQDRAKWRKKIWKAEENENETGPLLGRRLKLLYYLTRT